MPNLLKQNNDETRRPHNGVRFLDEFLGRHLLAYITYLMALALTAPLLPTWAGAKLAISFVVGLAFLFFVLGVYLATRHENFFSRHHGCAGKNCRIKIPRRDIWKLSKFNAIMAAIMFFTALGATVLVDGN